MPVREYFDRLLSDPYLEDALAEIVRRVKAAGANAYFVISPTLNSAVVSAPASIALEHGRVASPFVLKFNDPRKFPELFDAGNRYDPEHLNKSGAVVYTRLLADRLAKHLSDSPGDEEES